MEPIDVVVADRDEHGHEYRRMTFRARTAAGLLTTATLCFGPGTFMDPWGVTLTAEYGDLRPMPADGRTYVWRSPAPSLKSEAHGKVAPDEDLISLGKDLADTSQQACPSDPCANSSSTGKDDSAERGAPNLSAEGGAGGAGSCGAGGADNSVAAGGAGSSFGAGGADNSIAAGGAGSRDSQEGAPNRLKILGELGYGSIGVVYEAIISGKRAAFKSADAMNNWRACDKLWHESCVYDDLSPLQGSVIPELVAYGSTALGMVEFLATSLIQGEHPVAGSCYPPAVLDDAIKGLGLIHEHGFCHGGLHSKNIVVDPATGKVVFIDFGKARSAADFESREEFEAKCRKELEQLAKIFAGPSNEST